MNTTPDEARLAGHPSRAHARGPLSDAERSRILELHREGMSRNAIAREVGRAGGTVSGVVAAAGGEFERGPGVIAGTAAEKVYAADRRSRMVSRLYDQAEALMERLTAGEFKALAHNVAGEAVVTAVQRDAAPGRDVRHLVLALTSVMQAAAKLEAVDGETSKNEAATSVIDKLDAAMRLAYGA